MLHRQPFARIVSPIAALALIAAIVVTLGSASGAPEVAPPVAATPDRAALEAQLIAAFQRNLDATVAENLDAVAATMHPQGPAHAATIDTLRQIFNLYDLKYEVITAAFVALDGDYAILRIKQKTTKLAGPEFRNNVIDSYQILRKDADAWKLWQGAILSIEFAAE